jgi:hypothetical protein
MSIVGIALQDVLNDQGKAIEAFSLMWSGA